MNIIILVSKFVPSVLGGTEIATYNIAKHLAERGHEVHVITSHDKGLAKDSSEEGFFIHRRKIIKKPIIWPAIYFLHVIRTTRKYDPDIVHVKSIKLGLFALLIKKICHKPYTLWAQGSDIYFPAIPYRFFYKIILANADAVIAQTADEKRVIQNICNRDVMVISNGIDLSRFSILTKKECMNKLQIKTNANIILFVGSLREVKGVRYLIEAMRLLIKQNINVRLMLVGDGPERHKLEKLICDLDIGDYIILIGKVPNDRVIEYMTIASIFVLPSLSEGFPLVIVEAMASGLPIITTNITGLPEIIKENRNGYLVEPKNSTKIAEKILLLLKDDELRKRIAQYNRHDAQNYTWDEITDNLIQIYKSLLTD